MSEAERLQCKLEICRYIKSREEQKIFAVLSKKDPKRSVDDERQAINIQLESFLRKLQEVESKSLEDIVASKNTGKEKVPPLQFAKQTFEALVSLAPSQEQVVHIIDRFDDAVRKINEEHKPDIWLDKYSRYARGVSLATHVAKLTHSSINGASSFYAQCQQPDSKQANRLLTTEELAYPLIDEALDNASYAPVASILKLVVNGRTIANIISESEINPFELMTDDAEKSNRWLNDFSSVLRTERKAAHALTKQAYFPVSETNCTYHLLCILKSSSLAHHIHLAVKSDEESKKISKQRNNQKFHKNTFRRYPNSAKLATSSASDAKNVSPLHTKRGGKLTLFSSAPPIWQSQLKPPIYKKSLFFEPSIYWQVKEDIDYLRDFLLRFETIDLSIKDPKRFKWIEKWVGNIVDEVLFYIGSIQSLPSGWTDAPDIKLKTEHQYVLDPHRDGDDFQSAKANTDWLTVVCKDFADWLNYKLAGKNKQFTPQAQHSRLWIKLLEPELREFMQTMEFDRKRAKEMEE